MHNNEAGGVVGAIPYDSMSYYIIIKNKNDIHAPAALQKLIILFGF